MTTTLLILVPVFFAWALLSAFYSVAVRPILCDRVRFQIFALRDSLRRRAVDGHIAASSFQYVYLEKLLCRAVDKCAWFSWGSFLEFVWRHHDAKPSADALRFDATAEDELKQIHDTTVGAIVLLLPINSPIMTLTICVVVSVAKLFGAAWKQWLEIKTKVFVEEFGESAVVESDDRLVIA